MRGLLIDGIYGSGKSSIREALQRRKSLISSESTLFLSETFTQRLAEYDIGHNGSNILKSMGAILSVLEKISFMYNSSKISQDPRREMFSLFYFLESLHFNACARHQLSFDLFQEVDNRLASMKCKAVFIDIPEDQLLEQTVLSTKKYRHKEWGTYLDARYGENDIDKLEKISILQKQMKKAFMQSSMDKLVVSSKGCNWEEISEAILKWIYTS